jgi:diadenosine tetraphosphate (Ap4A) HIT family hydrolase
MNRSVWNGATVLHETPLMRAILDGVPVAPGHTLIIPRRDVVSLLDLTAREWAQVLPLIKLAYRASGAPALTLGVNDGREAGRSVDQLHFHAIPRWEGDVDDPAGGVRQLLTGGPANDPWITRLREQP